MLVTMATELKITNLAFQPLSDEGVDEELDMDNDDSGDGDNKKSEDNEESESLEIVEE